MLRYFFLLLLLYSPVVLEWIAAINYMSQYLYYCVCSNVIKITDSYYVIEMHCCLLSVFYIQNSG